MKRKTAANFETHDARSHGSRSSHSVPYIGNGAFRLKRLDYIWRKLLRVRATPHQIALGCAIGVFSACTPFFGLQMLMAGGLAYMMRVSIAAALIATFVGNPLSWPAIWSASYFAGAAVLGLDPVYAADTLAESASMIGATLLEPTPRALDAAAGNLASILMPLALGGILIGLLAAAGSYYPMRRAARVFQKRRALAVANAA